MAGRVLNNIEWLIIVMLFCLAAQLGYSAFELKKLLTPKTLPQAIIPIESLEILSKSSTALESHIQSTETFHYGSWGENNHLMIVSKSVGDFVEFRLPSRYEGARRLSVLMTKSYDYGVINIYLDDRLVIDGLDLFDEFIIATGPIYLGEVGLNSESRLKFVVRDKNSAAREPFYQFGIDGLVFEDLSP